MSLPLLSVRVARKSQEVPDICAFELVAEHGEALPPFTAGAHIDVHLPGGLTRPYSLCNNPAETDRYLIGVLRDPASRGGSRAMHDDIVAGETLQIGAPRNLFALDAAARRSLLLAGGIGVTPILCMAEALAAQGADFEFHYCARSRERAAFLPRLAAAPYADRVSLHFDDEAAAQRLDIAGLLSQAEGDTHLYVCGPRGFMDVVLAAARAQGWPQDRLHCEFFAGDVPPVEGDTAFEVELASSGRVIQVASDVSVVKALMAAGVEVMVSCEQGVCGTCLTRVLAGELDHRDSYLTPEERQANDQFLPCCSRARSQRLVLDL